MTKSLSLKIWCTPGQNERQDPTLKENVIPRRRPDASLWPCINFRFMSFSLFPVLFLSCSWIMWRCGPRPERYHRVSRFPTWLPQLRQLHVADNNRGEEPDPAHLCHAGAGRRLWYCLGLRRSAFARQPKNEVRADSLLPIWSFFPAPHAAPLPLTPSSALLVTGAVTAAQFFECLCLLKWEWRSLGERRVSASIWVDPNRFQKGPFVLLMEKPCKSRQATMFCCDKNTYLIHHLSKDNEI